MIAKLIVYFAVFMLGAIVSSALSCAVWKHQNKQSWVRGRSVCEGCKRTLRWWEIIPIFSALMLRGRCPRCKHYFGYRHTVSEAMLGFVFVVLFHLFIAPLVWP